MKLLYISAKYGIHDYRFLEKLVNDYEVLFLHYSANILPEEMKIVKNLKTIGRNPLFKSFPLIGGLANFKKIYNEFKPDIVHSGYVWQVGILPAMLDIHPHLSMVWGSDVLIEPDKNFMIKKIVRKVLKQADQIQCDAMHVKNKIISDYGVPPDNITVFPWGINLSLFRPLDKIECREKLKIEQNKLIFLFSRPLESMYGVENLMEAFNKFSKNKEDVVLYIAHEGRLKDYVIDFVDKHGLKEKVRLTGWIPYDEIPSLFKSADIFISTSTTDGTPLSLLEALACGLGLIVTGIPSIKEWVDDSNGIVIPVNDREALYNALEKYYNDRSLLNVHSGRNLVIADERADWEKNYLKLKEIYYRMLKA